MATNKSRSAARNRRHIRVRKIVAGSSEQPRLNVFRSLAEIYAQVIDDEAGRTLAAASTIDSELRSKMAGLKKTEQARLVGKTARRAGKSQRDRQGCIRSRRLSLHRACQGAGRWRP